MDQIFDRLGTLLKSFISGDRSPGDASSSGGPRSGATSDPDLDDAMEELDAYLNNDRQEQERLEREREHRRQEAERQARSRYSRAGASTADRRPSPSGRLVSDFLTLGLPYGSPMKEVKSAYKRLLKEHHPDRHGESQDAQRRATEYSVRLNEAYAHIEVWSATGKFPEEP